MTLQRLAVGLFAALLSASLAAPAAAEQTFWTITTGPVVVHAAPPGAYGSGYQGGGYVYYYDPCMYGLGSRTPGFGFSRGSRSNRFYPYDPRQNGNFIGRGHGGGYGTGCYGMGNGLYGGGYGGRGFRNRRVTPRPGRGTVPAPPYMRPYGRP